jgi:hypothetical protein
MSTVEAQVEELERAVEDFVDALLAAEEKGFLAPLGRWTPRDVVAHLIGWNRYTVEGCREIREGRLPFYDVDPGENYSKVNALLVREVTSVDRNVLLGELRNSVSDLKDYLRGVALPDWERDFGVRHRGKAVTLRSSVDELIEDYVHHRRQLADWAVRPSE